MRARCAFTLIELLVVILIISLLVGILLPVLSKAKHSAWVMQCLSNMRMMEVAHNAYMVDNNGHLIRANLSHAGVTHGPFLPWFETLQSYYDNELVARSPLDTSPHWGPAPMGEPIPAAPADQRRVTSYGINNFLDISTVPYGPNFAVPFEGYTQSIIPQPSNTVHFLIMAFEGEFAGADHPHIESWISHPSPPFKAQEQSQINAVRGGPESNEAISNWGFLDGHAKSMRFGDLLTDEYHNRFDPWVTP